MPTSCTSTPLASSPRASTSASSGPERRPSRPIAIAVPPALRTSVPSARPMSSTASTVRLRPTIPRMSYALKISGATRLIGPQLRGTQAPAAAASRSGPETGRSRTRRARRSPGTPAPRTTRPRRPGANAPREKRVVGGVEHQRRHLDPVQPRLRARARPVVRGVAKTVERGGHDIVELAQRARARDPLAIEEPRETRELGGALALQGREEVARVDQVESAPKGVTRRREIERGGHRGRRAHDRARRATALAQPFEQRISAQGHAHRIEGRRSSLPGQAPQHPVDLGAIARTVCAREPIQLAAATAKVRQRRPPAARVGRGQHRASVVAPPPPPPAPGARGPRRPPPPPPP